MRGVCKWFCDLTSGAGYEDGLGVTVGHGDGIAEGQCGALSHGDVDLRGAAVQELGGLDMLGIWLVCCLLGL